MSFLTLVFAIFCGVFVGMWAYNSFTGMVLWLQHNLSMQEYGDTGKMWSMKNQDKEKKQFNKWPLLLIVPTFLLFTGMLVWSVNPAHNQDDEEKNRQIQINETSKPLLMSEPLKVAVTPPPELVPPSPPPPQKTRTIYIDGRKGYLQTFSVWWEDIEAFENLMVRYLPSETQLVPHRLYSNKDNP